MYITYDRLCIYIYIYILFIYGVVYLINDLLDDSR